MSSILSFANLKEQFQDSAIAKPLNYNNEPSFSPIEGVRIYIGSLDKLTDKIKVIFEKTNALNSFKGSAKAAGSPDLTDKKNELAQLYLKSSLIIQEFIKGFSVTKDSSAIRITSLLYKGFNAAFVQFELAYVTGKTSYYSQSLKILARLRELFSLMLPYVAPKNDVDNVPNSTNNLTSANDFDV